jgi:DNA-binding GntR family transcriptional regulator
MEESINKKVKMFQKQNISEDLMAYIKEQILTGELNPGDRIVETKLAKELGISQTPVREALRHLQGEGLIKIIPNKGPIVSPLDTRAVFEIFSIRSMLEGLAIRLATQNATSEDIADLENFYREMQNKLDDDTVQYLLQDSFYIHEKIVNLSRHRRLIAMYKSLSFQIALVNRLVGTKFTKQKEVEMHWELVEVVKAGDPDDAEKTIRKHIYRSYMEFVEILNDSKSEKFESDEQMWF